MKETTKKQGRSISLTVISLLLCVSVIAGIIVFVNLDFHSITQNASYISEEPSEPGTFAEQYGMSLPTLDGSYADTDSQELDGDLADDENSLTQPVDEKQLRSAETNQNYKSYSSESVAEKSRRDATTTTTKVRVTTTTAASSKATTSSYTTKSGLTILSTGVLKLVYFCQIWPEFKNLPYGSNTIGGYGCAPTDMAMIVSTLTGKTVYPDETAKWAVANGHYVKNVGTTHAYMTAAAKHYGVKVSTVSKSDKSKIISALKSGKILATVMGKGHFTKGGHFMIIRGVTDSGKLLVADSGSYARSTVEWDYDLIISELKISYFWVYEK